MSILDLKIVSFLGFFELFSSFLCNMPIKLLGKTFDEGGIGTGDHSESSDHSAHRTTTDAAS